MKKLNLSLTACSFHLKKFNKKSKEYIYPLNKEIEKKDSDGTVVKRYQDVIEVFKDFFNEYSDYKEDMEEKRLFSCNFIEEDYGETSTYRYITATISSGTYGVASNIIDKETKAIVHNRTNNQADEKKFYMMIVVPKDNDKVRVEKGLILFQNIGQYGVKTVTTRYINEYLKTKFGISFYSGNISPDIFVKSLFDRKMIAQMILKKNYKSNDNADKIYKGYGEEVRVLSKLILDAPLKDKMKTFAKGKVNVFEFEDINYDQLKLRVESGGRFRTIDLHNIENLSIIEGIPNEILEIDGQVNKIKLVEYFKTILIEYIDSMVFQINEKE